MRVAEHHLRLTKQGKSLAFQCVGNASPVIVNGQPSTGGILNSGDIFVVGNTQMRFVAGKSSRMPQIGFGQQQGGVQQQQPWQQAPQAQQPAARQSVPMQPVAPRQPGVAPQQPTQQAPAPASRPVIQIKKPD